MTKTFAIDFDGTVVTQDFPKIGKDIGAVPVLKKLVEKGHKLILFTMRSNRVIETSEGIKEENYLTEAINWFKFNDIPLYGIQKNPTQHTWTDSLKCYANYIIDDSALFIPLIFDKSISKRPFVNWSEVEKELIKLKLI